MSRKNPKSFHNNRRWKKIQRETLNLRRLADRAQPELRRIGD
jgi:hypothetical protein